MLARNDWGLLPVGRLAVEAAALAGADTVLTQASAERLCQQAYAQCLCAAVQDPQRREVAYRELHAYLYRIARRQRPHLAEDAAQEAILLVYQKVHTCRSPGAFLKFAIYQLLTAFQRLTPSSREISLEETLTADDASEREPPSNLPDLETEAVDRAEIAVFLRWLRDLIQEHPRARTQLLAVTMKYLEGWEDGEIAAALDTTAANVYVLRSRGLGRLRAEYGRFLAAQPLP